MRTSSVFSILSLIAIAASAVPIPAPVPDIIELAGNELEARTPVLGMLFRGGRKVGKDKGKGGGDNTQASKATIDKMAKNMGRYLGKEQDKGCVARLHNTLSRTGGFNGNIDCNKNPDKNSIGYRMDQARKNLAARTGGKKKRDFIEDELDARESLSRLLLSSDLGSMYYDFEDRSDREFQERALPEERLEEFD